MSCAVGSEDLLAFVDGELGWAARRAMARHLLECTSCRDETTRLRSLSRDLAEIELDKAPAGIIERVRAEFTPGRVSAKRRDAALRRLTWRRVWAYAGVMVVAVSALVTVVDRYERRETGKSMVSALVGDAQKQRETKAICNEMVRAFDTREPMAMLRRPGFTAIIYDARVAKDGDMFLMTNFSFAGGSGADIRDEYGNLYVPIAMPDWEGPLQLVWLTPLRPNEVVGRPRELTLTFAGRDITTLRGTRSPEPVAFDFMALDLRPPKGGLDLSGMLTRMMANAGLDVATQRELARQLRIMAPEGMDALREAF